MIRPRIKYFHISKEILYHKLIDKLGITDKKCIIFLNGNVGAGKTTFVKSFLSHKEYPIDATSPTFTIVNEYHFEYLKLSKYIEDKDQKSRNPPSISKILLISYIGEMSSFQIQNFKMSVLLSAVAL